MLLLAPMARLFYGEQDPQKKPTRNMYGYECPWVATVWSCFAKAWFCKSKGDLWLLQSLQTCSDGKGNAQEVLQAL